MLHVIEAIVDHGEFLEVHRNFAKNIIVGFCRMGGMPVGVIANQPSFLAGVLDIQASRKAARFVRFCDCFNIPILTLVDVPGFLPGSGQEYGGIIIHGAKLLFAYGEATVPKVTVTLRKSYGGAHDVMSCKQLRGDANYAWPSAQIAVMGASGAIEVLYGKEVAAIENAEEKAKFIQEKVNAYDDAFANPYQAASFGYIDDVIEPRNTRFRVIRAFESLRTKKVVNPPKNIVTYLCKIKKYDKFYYTSHRFGSRSQRIYHLCREYPCGISVAYRIGAHFYGHSQTAGNENKEQHQKNGCDGSHPECQHGGRHQRRHSYGTAHVL